MKIKSLLMASAAFLFSATVQAQSWPTQPVRIVVPYPPGGNVDVAARIIAPGLEAAFGQTFVVENKPGAGHILLAGSFTRTVPVGKGDTIHADYGPLGSISVHFA